jgi:hypothetical protein
VAPLTLALLLALARDRPAFVDRIEGDRAVLLLRGRARSVPRKTLQAGVGEGQVVRDGAPDPEATRRRRREVKGAAERIAWRRK